MAEGLKRVGLRSDDVNALVREFSSYREEGLGPNEAWARAKSILLDVDSQVIENWRPEVERQYEGGTAAAPRTVATDVVARNNLLEAENIALKKKLAELGMQNERLTHENESLVLGEETNKKKKG
jgi:hypothetical protein